MTSREEAQMYRALYYLMCDRYEELCLSLRKFSIDAQQEFDAAAEMAEDISADSMMEDVNVLVVRDTDGRRIL